MTKLRVLMTCALGLGIARCGKDSPNAPAPPSPVVDQAHEPFPGAHAAVFGPIAQTFTVGKTGTLTSIDLGLRRGTPSDDVLRIDIRWDDRRKPEPR